MREPTDEEIEQLTEAILRVLRGETGEEEVLPAPPAVEPAEPEAEPPRNSGGSSSSSSGGQAADSSGARPDPDAAQATRGGDAFVADSSVPTAAAAPPTAAHLQRAAEAGRHAGRRNVGLVSGVPPTPSAPSEFEAQGFWVVIRPVIDLVGQPLTLRGLVTGPYCHVEGYVVRENGVLSCNCIFHGFATREEAEAYWAAAFPREALPALPARWRQ